MNQATLTVIDNHNAVLKGELAFNTVASLDKQGQAAINKTNLINIDLQKLERVDSAGLALLLGWLRQAKQKQCEIVFHNAPMQLANLAKVSGLNDILMFEKNSHCQCSGT